ncbi:MAG: hypothetical protein DRM98_01915 [Thermoplasmata archaeon]|nr:MAG: hypothetical protein DRM98_01915 [Thermoplasmata archaeon]
MKTYYYLKDFIEDENAVSEEFTTLPALSIVMIGFTLFILLIANTYTAYDVRIDNLEKYQTADFIATKLTNPDCFFIREGGIVDLPLLKKTESKEKLNSIREEYQRDHVDFIVRISWESTYLDFPEDLPINVGAARVAVSKDVGVYLNEAQTKPGKLTIIMWSVPL